MRLHPYFFIFLTLLIVSCNGRKSTSTMLDSDDFENKNERLEKLSGEIKLYSKITDAEFELFNVNGFSNQRETVPGASSLDYKFAIKIDSSYISKWTTGMIDTVFEKYEYSWASEIIKNRKENWQLHSAPRCFIRKGDNVIVLVYKKEGVIFKKVHHL
ncbi:hypothetical protein BH11BAC5_BH11BAC5_14540 [soil metagenome]